MTSNVPVLDTERAFFDALIAPSSEILSRIVAEDFLMIDVMTGSEIPRSAFLDFMASGQLIFESIEPAETKVRTYGTVSVVTGRTLMQGRIGDNRFTTRSRYTHVYVQSEERWLLVSAQGTPIA